MLGSDGSRAADDRLIDLSLG